MCWDKELKALEDECYFARLNALADLAFNKNINQHTRKLSDLIEKLDALIVKIFPDDPHLLQISQESIALAVIGFHLYRLKGQVIAQR